MVPVEPINEDREGGNVDSQYAVHPVAELFPMLAEDELRELAEDIRQRGLLQPIVLDSSGSILDGRNRLAACQLAGVEPTFVAYQGDDPAGYALAVNITRRHLSTGARAIIAAEAARMNGLQFVTQTSDGLPTSRISEANQVLDWAPGLKDSVKAGITPLSKAVETARAEKRADEERRSKVDRLRSAASDLAALVEEERMSVDDATAALDAREAQAEAQEQQDRAEEARRKQVATELMGHVEKVARLAGSDTMERYDPELAVNLQQRRITRRMLEDARTALSQIEEVLTRRELL